MQESIELPQSPIQEISKTNITPAFTEVLAAIENNNGAIPFSQFMQIAHAGDNGYYSQGRAEIAGEDADFKTRPEMFHSFGHTLGKFAHSVWVDMGKPDEFPLMELGAGTGAMALDALDYLKSKEPELYERVRYTIVDFPGMIERQQLTLAQHAEKVSWLEGPAVEVLEGLSDYEGVIWSNENPDDYPIEVVSRKEGKLLQKYIAVENGELIERWKEPSPQVENYIQSYNIDCKEGWEEPINLQAIKLQQTLNKAVRKGVVLTIDYGTDARSIGGLKDGRAAWAMKDGFHDYIEEAYRNVGKLDMTSCVNFRAQRIAARDGNDSVLTLREIDFFKAAGAKEIVEDSPDKEAERGLFVPEYLPFCALVTTKGIELSGLEVSNLNLPFQVVAPDRVKDVESIIVVEPIQNKYVADAKNEIAIALQEKDWNRFHYLYSNLMMLSVDDDGRSTYTPSGLVDQLIIVVWKDGAAEILYDMRDPEEMARLLRQSNMAAMLSVDEVYQNARDEKNLRFLSS